MSRSLNEIEATAKRAARGAGLSWGLAEEAGRATRWLCAQRLDGCAALALALCEHERGPVGELSVPALSGAWSASPPGRLTPLIAGPALSDRAALIGEAGIAVRDLLAPMLILPFAAALARQRQRLAVVAWDGLSTATDGQVLSLDGNRAPLSAAVADKVTVRIGGALGRPQPVVTRAAPRVGDWAALERLAHRTFAPASEASRLLGAGAGLSDND